MAPLSKFALDYAHKSIGKSLIIHADSFEWMGRIPENSIHGIVADPPYGVKEYEFDQLEKRANGNGGIWRIPPSFDGSVRQPLPRFTALNEKERKQVSRFFTEWAKAAVHVLRPGGHVFLACNSFLCQMVYSALVSGGLEFRGQLIRLVQTLRGGDRPKNAEEEFPDVCSLPRGSYEPWAILRKPMPAGMKASDCLRQFETGGLRRLPEGLPFSDLVQVGRTPETWGQTELSPVFCANQGLEIWGHFRLSPHYSWLVLILPLFFIGLVMATCTASWAVAHEKGRFEFQGDPVKYPVGDLVFDAQGNLYGATLGPPSAVFRFAPKVGGGWSYSQIYVFDLPSKGSQLEAGLVLDEAGVLYGTTAGGGANDGGVVFALAPDLNGKWTETVLYDFEAYPGDASVPVASLIFDAEGNLYGTASAGGAYGFGAVFELTPNSDGQWTEVVLYSFIGSPNDGAVPVANLAFDVAGNLYGTTLTGGPGVCQVVGTFGCGTVFQLSPPSMPGGAWTEATIHNFLGGNDGQFPVAGVALDAVSNVYGTTEKGGGLCGGTGCGTVFELSLGSGGWTQSVIHLFSLKDGVEPEGSLVFDAVGDLYGTTFEGGTYGYGTVFQLKRTAGGWRENGFYSFTGNNDGAGPTAGVLFDARGNIYGTTQFGGIGIGYNGLGTTFVGHP